MEHIQSSQNIFIPWNYPTRPSSRARKLIEELNRQGREDFNTCGPAVEYRDGIYWIDICYQGMSKCGKFIKLAIEVDEEHHDDPLQKSRDQKKDEYLKSRGWEIKRLHHSYFDSKNVEEIALEILLELGDLQGGFS